MPLLKESLHERNLLGDMFRGTWHHIRLRHAQRLHIRTEDRLPTIGEGANLLPLFRRGTNDLVVDVGEVDDPTDSVATRTKPAHEEVGEEEAAEVADMRRTVDGGAAGVDPDLFRVQRRKGSCRTRECVAQLEATHRVVGHVSPPSARRGGVRCNAPHVLLPHRQPDYLWMPSRSPHWLRC